MPSVAPDSAVVADDPGRHPVSPTGLIENVRTPGFGCNRHSARVVWRCPAQSCQLGGLGRGVLRLHRSRAGHVGTSDPAEHRRITHRASKNPERPGRCRGALPGAGVKPLVLSGVVWAGRRHPVGTGWDHEGAKTLGRTV